MNTSRKHSGTISPKESSQLEALVFDLVRERLLKAIGPQGMWSVSFRATTDTDALFGVTIAEYIAKDIAEQIAAPTIEVADHEFVHDELAARDQEAGGHEAGLETTTIVENLIVENLTVDDHSIETVALETILVEEIADAVMADAAMVDAIVADPGMADEEVLSEDASAEIEHEKHWFFKPRKAA